MTKGNGVSCVIVLYQWWQQLYFCICATSILVGLSFGSRAISGLQH